jgi:hypothetical protein
MKGGVMLVSITCGSLADVALALGPAAAGSASYAGNSGRRRAYADPYIPCYATLNGRWHSSRNGSYAPIVEGRTL